MFLIGKSNFFELEACERSFQVINRYLGPLKKLSSQSQFQGFFLPDTYLTKKVGKISLHSFQSGLLWIKWIVGESLGSSQKWRVLDNKEWLKEQNIYLCWFHSNVHPSKRFSKNFSRYRKEQYIETTDLVLRIFGKKYKYWIDLWLIFNFHFPSDFSHYESQWE